MEQISKYIDIDTALARVRGNKTLYRRMLGLFLQSTEFAALEESLENKDYTKAGEVAHAIKGMTGNLALDPLFEASMNLMNQLRQGTHTDADIATYRSALEGTIEAVKALVAQLEAEA